MDADDHQIEVILSEGRRFMVPLYQRKYQWADNRLEPFWEDVEAKAKEVLEGGSKFEHYMGALILAPIGTGERIGATPRVQVVDGQQRLTTFQLLLAAIREVARKFECEDIISYVEDYIFNKLKSKDTDPLTKFKLTPTPSDRELFHSIIENKYSQVRLKYHKYYYGNRVPKNTSHRALRAYELFYNWVGEFALFGSADKEEQDEKLDKTAPEAKEIIEERLESLLRAILNRMKLVVITLGEEDDAQVIFETLNSKGEPLLAMDLVRNNIFYRAEKEGASAEALYKELWDPFDEDWWRVSAPNARPKRPRIDHFLSHVLAAQTGEKISVRELYSEYRAFVSPKGKPRFPEVETELRLLEGYAPVYRAIEGHDRETYPDLAWLGEKLSTWQITTVYPVVFQIAKSEIDMSQRKELYSLIYSFIVRRALCGLTAKNLNQVFQSLGAFLISNGVSLGAFKDFFAMRTGDSTRFPSDEEFKSGILSQPAYNLAPGNRIKDVLWELELKSRTGFAEKSAKPSGLQTEHVLPVMWTEEWPFSDGEWVNVWADDPKSMRRNQLKQTLGNLTLITGGLNSSASNNSFSHKKEKFGEHTALFLNKWFSKHDDWNEQKIEERGNHFATLACDIWVGLD